MNFLIFYDYNMLMHDNDVKIRTVFLRFDLPKVDNTFSHDYNHTTSLLSGNNNIHRCY